MRNLYWFPTATNQQKGYVILTAFPLQQWLQERTSMLRYMYIGCSVIFIFLNRKWKTKYSELEVFRDFNLHWIYSRIHFLFTADIPEYFNSATYCLSLCCD
jgi:hypothetical protein